VDQKKPEGSEMVADEEFDLDSDHGRDLDDVIIDEEDSGDGHLTTSLTKDKHGKEGGEGTKRRNASSNGYREDSEGDEYRTPKKHKRKGKKKKRRNAKDLSLGLDLSQGLDPLNQRSQTQKIILLTLLLLLLLLLLILLY
jgi:hypothetical protein